MGWMGGDPPPPDPNIGLAAKASSELAKDQFDWSKSVFSDIVQPYMKRDMDLREQIGKQFLESSRKQDESADYQLGLYKEIYEPMERRAARDAMEYDSADNVGRLAGRDIGYVNQQFSNARGQQARAAGRYGLSSTAFDSEDFANAQALAAAGAGTNAADNAFRTAATMRAAGVGVARGVPNAAAGLYQGANAAGAAAGNSSAQGAGVTNGGLGFMRGGYSTSGALYGQQGRLGGMISDINMKGYEANMGLLGDLFGAAGTAAGFFLKDGGLVNKYADGGEVDGDDPYTSAAEAQVNSALGLKAGGPVSKRLPKIKPRSTTTKGGEVDGPGGPKDDRVPALLSDGEFVMPVGTVKKYGVAKLEKMRQDGLEFEKQLGIGRS